MKTVAMTTRGRSRRVYSEAAAATTKVETKPAPLSEGVIALGYLKGLDRPCSITEIHEHLGSHLDKKDVLAVMDGIVKQGNIQHKTYNSNRLYMYTGPSTQSPCHKAALKKHKNAKNEIEKEIAALKAEITEKEAKLQNLREMQKLKQKMEEMQEKQKAALENWHLVLKSDGDLQAIERAGDDNCRDLLKKHQALQTKTKLLERLYRNFSSAICVIEGIDTEQLHKLLGITDETQRKRNQPSSG